MYCVQNYKSKKAMREDFKNGVQIVVFTPGGIFEGKRDGRVAIEGPHYPKPHTWYADVTIAEGVIVKIHS